VLGWKYVDAKEESQRYKIGKFILETKRVVRWTEHDGGCDDAEEVGRVEAGGGGLKGNRGGDDTDVQFDSQDEDECEDLFSGVWSVGLARKRRARRG
jgi:hypothetical protein